MTMSYQTYVPEHAKNVAKGMLQRYGNRKTALEECRRNASSPLTTLAGQKFWELVLQEIEKIEEPSRNSRSVK